MKTVDYNYFIERYLDNEMELPERQWFEKELQGNPALVRELELRRRTNMLLAESSDVLLMREKMAGIAMEHSKRLSQGSRKYINYAATIALLLIAGTALLLPNRKLTGDRLFEKYYETAITAGESVSRSGDNALSADYLLALDNYREGNYEAAIAHFLEYTTSGEGNPEINMMLGNSYAETRQYIEAGISYNKVIDHNNNLYIEDATWLLALCYLKTGERDMALERLSAIHNSDSRYSRDAARIIRRLK